MSRHSPLDGLVAKVAHYDNDERYMAISDITNELSKAESRLDVLMERKIVTAILDRLEKDTSNDVQTMAVKCLSVLVTRANDQSVQEISTRLCNHILTGRAELRDVYGIGLKTLIERVPSVQGSLVADASFKHLLSGIDHADAGVRTECLDAVSQVLRRFGAQPGPGAPAPTSAGMVVAGVWDAPRLQKLAEASLRQLADASSANVRKRATATVSALSPCLSDGLLESVVGSLIAGIEGGRGAGTKRSSAASNAGVLANADARTLISTIGGVAKQVGARLGRHLPAIIPLFLAQLGDPSDAEEANNAEPLNELRENCLHAFESVLLTCARELGGGGGGGGAPPQQQQQQQQQPAGAPTTASGSGSGSYADASHQLPRIVDAALAFARFDPNFAYGGGEEASESAGGAGDDVDMGGSGSGGMDMDAGDEDEEDDGYGDEDEDDDYGGGGAYGDEDDSSWKVRRACIRVLSALIASRLVPAGAVDASGAKQGPLAFVFARIVPALVARLRGEREEAVRLDVIAALGEAIKAAGSASGSSSGSAEMEAPLQSLGAATLPVAVSHAKSAAAAESAAAAAAAASSSAGDVAMGDASSSSSSASGYSEASLAASALLSCAAPSVINACLSHVAPGGNKGASAHLVRTGKTKTGALGLLQRLITALGASGDAGAVGSLTPFLPQLFACLRASIAAGTGPASSPTAASGAEGSAQLRLDALCTLHVLLLALSHSLAAQSATGGAAAAALASHLAPLPALLAVATSDDYYRLSAQALRTGALVLTLLRPGGKPASPGAPASLRAPLVGSDFFPSVVQPLASAILTRIAVSGQGADLEVQEAAITACGVLLAHAGDVPPLTAPDQLASAASGLAARMRSEHTRSQALRAVAYAASSPLNLPLAAPLAPAVASDFPGYLRQASKQTRLQALATLTALVTSSRGALPAEALAPSLVEAAGSMGDSDLNLTSAAVDLAVAVLEMYAPATAAALLGGPLLQRTLRLASAQVLTGAVAASLQTLLGAAAALGAAQPTATPFTMPALADGVISGARSALQAAASAAGGSSGVVASSSGVLSVTARSLASVITHSSPAEAKAALAGLCGTAVSPDSPGAGSLLHSLPADAARALALRTVGEAGKRVDLTSPSALGSALPQQLVSAFDAPSEEARNAAAWALGSVAAGPGNAAAATIPLICEGLSAAAAAAAAPAAPVEGGSGAGTGAAATERAYLFVCALRATATAAGSLPTPAASLLASTLPGVVGLLSAPHVSACADVGVRTAVAETLGRFAAVGPDTVISSLLALVRSPEAHSRWTGITAVKHAAASPAAIAVLSSPRDGFGNTAGALLAATVDPDLGVRLAGLSAVSALAHTAPALLAPLLGRVPAGRFTTPPPAPAKRGAAAAPPADPSAPPAWAPPSPPSYPSEGLLSVLLFESTDRRDLVVEINMGPFVHRRDNGLPLRKAALGALDALITGPAAASSGARGALGPELLPVLLGALRDQDEVKIAGHTVLLHAARALGPAFTAALLADALPVAVAFSETIGSYDPIAAGSAVSPTAGGSSAEGAGAGTDSGPSVTADLARSGVRTLDGLARAVPALVGSHQRPIAQLLTSLQARMAFQPIFASVSADAAAFSK